MGRIYHRSWRRRKALALSLGAGVVAAFVLPASGQDSKLDGAVVVEDTRDLNLGTFAHAGLDGPPWCVPQALEDFIAEVLAAELRLRVKQWAESRPCAADPAASTARASDQP
jgi:hypothetical protein